jgi:hypothetical protein
MIHDEMLQANSSKGLVVSVGVVWCLSALLPSVLLNFVNYEKDLRRDGIPLSHS